MGNETFYGDGLYTNWPFNTSGRHHCHLEIYNLIVNKKNMVSGLLVYGFLVIEYNISCTYCT